MFFPLERCKRKRGDRVVGVGEDCMEVGRIGGAEDGGVRKLMQKVGWFALRFCLDLLSGLSILVGISFVKCTGIFKDDSVYTLHSSVD